MAGDMSRPVREADAWQIEDAIRMVGGLWAAEQVEGDDEGIAQVEGIVKALRTFADHEAQEHEDDPPQPCPCCGWVAVPCACC